MTISIIALCLDDGMTITTDRHGGALFTYNAAVTRSAELGYVRVLFSEGRGWQPLDWPGRWVRECDTPQHRAYQRAKGRRNAAADRAARARRRAAYRTIHPAVVITAVALARLTCGLSLAAVGMYWSAKNPRSVRGGWPLYARAGGVAHRRVRNRGR
jgi:hypothetical protein